MSQALRYGLMGAAQGFLQGMQQNVQAAEEEAKTERLQQARMLEQQELLRLQQEYKTADRDSERKYNEQQKADDRNWQQSEAIRKESVAADSAAERRDFELQLERERSKRYASTGGSAAREYLVEVDGSQMVVTGDQLNQLQEEGRNVNVLTAPAGVRLVNRGKDDKPRDKADGKPGLMTGQTSEVPTMKGVPGGTKENPIDAASLATKPPSGTWVRLPSGNVVQVP